MEKIAAINAELQVLVEENGCNFVNHDNDFFLASGEINDGFFDNDMIHPNLLGSNKIARSLNLVCKNRQSYNIATRRPRAVGSQLSTDVGPSQQPQSKTKHNGSTFRRSSYTHNPRRENRPVAQYSEGPPKAQQKSPKFRQVSFDNRSSRTPSRENLSHSQKCWFCSETNHMSASCRFGRPIVCHNCGESGHKKKFCSWRPVSS